MNQCSRNRRRYAAVLVGQLVKRRDGCRVAQYHGNGASGGAVLGNALSAGLWLRHSKQPEFAPVHVIHDDNGLCADGQNRVLQHAGIPLIHGFGNRDGFVVGHGCLRSGPIPPMSESYSVTCNASTLILQAAA